MSKNPAFICRRLFCLLLMLVLLASINSLYVFGASAGTYIATAIPQYRNPITGAIDDSGGEGSYALGQSMTESATHNVSLVEVDCKGNVYGTIRLKLQDNVQGVSWQVSSSGSFSSVAANQTQENLGENTIDYRIPLPSEDAIIRCSMYVVPMGREVIFYITLSGLQWGNGDFISTIDTSSHGNSPETYQSNQGKSENTDSLKSEKADKEKKKNKTDGTSSKDNKGKKPVSKKKNNSKKPWIIGGVGTSTGIFGLGGAYYVMRKKRENNDEDL